MRRLIRHAGLAGSSYDLGGNHHGLSVRETLFKFQARRSTGEDVPSGQFLIIKEPLFQQLRAEWDFKIGFKLSCASMRNRTCLKWKVYVILIVTSIHDTGVYRFGLYCIKKILNWLLLEDSFQWKPLFLVENPLLLNLSLSNCLFYIKTFNLL